MPWKWIAILAWIIGSVAGYGFGRTQTIHVHDVTDSIVHNPDDNTLSFNGVTIECQKPSEWRIK